MKQIYILFISLFFTSVSTIVQADDWYYAPSLNVPRGGSAAVYHDHYIYVFGGKSYNNRVLNSVETYDLNTGVWDTTTVPPFKYPRYNATTVVFEDKIYLMGGQSGESALKAVEVYDPVQKSWLEVHHLRRDREALAGAVFNDRIYAIGGQKDTQTLIDDIEWYDQPGDDWLDAIFNLPYPRAAHFYNVLGNTFYMFGGYYYGPTRTAYKAVPGIEGYQWLAIGELSQSRAYGAATRVRNEIYLIGGESTTGKTNMVEVFNTDTEQFGPCEPISSPRSGHTAVTVQDTVIYVIGGFESIHNDPVATVEFYYGELTTSIQEDLSLPLPVSQILIKGYPNPFNSGISLDVRIPVNDRYTMDVYNIAGQMIQTLHNGNLPLGNHLFRWQADPNLSSGLYFMIIRSEKYYQKYKMVYVK